jgi:cyclophilin family peptidyl-prolyl cis-trans isomerase
VVPPGREGVGHPYAFKGNRFYRVVHDFMIQTGTPTESVYGGHFPDDPGGLALPHNRPGLVSMANNGPGSNAGQVSIALTPVGLARFALFMCVWNKKELPTIATETLLFCSNQSDTRE